MTICTRPLTESALTAEAAVLERIGLTGTISP
jgi:hypothetical protein